MKEGFVHTEEKEIKEIWRRIKKRDFSGNTGLAVKNSIYQFSITLIAKGGSLFFTIILARLLMPELFGLYSLALSTILVFSAFSELGIGSALVRYVSRELGRRNKRKAKAYILYFGKVKLLLIGIFALLLLILSRFISESYYQKPIFLALLAGIFYIFFVQIIAFFQFILQSTNYFKGILYKEIILQMSRLIIVPLTVLLVLKSSFSIQSVLFFVLLALSFAYFFAAIFISFLTIKKTSFFKEKTSKLTSSQKKDTHKFLFAVSATALSGIFFAYVDRIILGHFVLAEFIGYYSAAINLVGGLIPIVGFSAAVLLPIFSRLKGKRLLEGLKKSENMILLFSFLIFFFVLFLAPLAIKIVYGSAYASAINILRFLSILLIVIPLTSLHQVYFISKGKPGIVARLLIFSTILNIFLNYILIGYMLKYGNLAAVYGAAIATLTSQFFYLGGLVFFKKKI